MNKSIYQKLLFFSLLIFLTVSATPLLAQQKAIKKVSIDETEKMAKEDPDNVILDVRTPGEIAEGHIEGAIFADYLGEDFVKKVEGLDKDKTYLMVCKVGGRASKATQLMIDLGFPNVFVMEGGMDSWLKAGKPVVK